MGRSEFNRVEHECRYVLKNGRKCTQIAIQDNRCQKHPLTSFPDQNVANKIDYSERELKTIEQIRDTYEWLTNEYINERIKSDKARVLSELLKAQLTVLNEIYKRSPEGQEKTLDQIGKMVAMARTLSADDASRILLSKNFGQMLDQAAEENVIEVQEAKTLEEKIDGAETYEIQQPNLLGYGGQSPATDDSGSSASDADDGIDPGAAPVGAGREKPQ